MCLVGMDEILCIKITQPILFTFTYIARSKMAKGEKVLWRFQWAIAKFCDFKSRSVLVKKYSDGLYWPKIGWAPVSKDHWATLTFTLQGLSVSTYTGFFYTFYRVQVFPVHFTGKSVNCTEIQNRSLISIWNQNRHT